MRRQIWRVNTVLLLWVVTTAAMAPPLDDAAAIRELQAQQALAWNKHDAAAYADLFTEDADVVNVLGWWWRGRSQIEAKLSDAFVWIFRDSTLTIDDVHVRFLDTSTAIVHVLWTMDGAKAPPGAPLPPRQGIQLQVLRKAEGRWQIASFQNTNSSPEVPFPKGPPPAPMPESR